MTNPVPATVRDAYRITGTPSQQLGSEWDNGLRYGAIVVAEVADPIRAHWSAQARDALTIDGVRLAAPHRASDGRANVGGWKATHYTPGERTSNVDDLVTIGLRLDDSLSQQPIPAFAHDPIPAPWDTADIYRIADHAAFSQHPDAVLAPGLDLSAEPTPALHWALTMAADLQEFLDDSTITAAIQPCHADLAGTTITPPSGPPVITDIVCVARPYGYTSALAIVDGLIAEAADDRIVERHTHIPNSKQLLLRAALYRVFIHALHPEATPTMRTHLERVCTLLTSHAGKR